MDGTERTDLGMLPSNLLNGRVNCVSRRGSFGGESSAMVVSVVVTSKSRFNRECARYAILEDSEHHAKRAPRSRLRLNHRQLLRLHQSRPWQISEGQPGIERRGQH